MKKRIFVICPVRNVSKEVSDELDAYVAELEMEGAYVHYPPRDTPQNDDPIGNIICWHNHRGIHAADEVHIWYDETSSGSHFDVGGLFMLIKIFKFDKRVILINKDRLKPTPHKSFLNVILYLVEKTTT